MNKRALISVALVAAPLLVGSSVAARPGQSDLAAVRAATAAYHDVSQAEAAGHELGYTGPALDHCIAHPEDGAMGYHYFDRDSIHDLEIDPLRPEGLVYEPGPNGRLRLVAVEWIVRKSAWDAEYGEDAPPPQVLGQEMHVLNPVLGWYILHAWVWKPNPSGMFNDWNPNVDCS